MASGIKVEYSQAVKVLEGSKSKADIAGERIVVKGSLILEAAAKKEFLPRPLGSMRVAQKTGRVYYAGAPDYPANPPHPTQRTGNLRNSIGMRYVKRLGYGRWESGTGPNMMYGPYVEYGTTRSRKFPYMEPALHKSWLKLQELANKEWKAVGL